MRPEYSLKEKATVVRGASSVPLSNRAAVPDDTTGQVAIQMRNLDEQIAKLQSVMNNLFDRLTPVLREPELAGSEGSSAPTPTTPLASVLQDYGNRIDSVGLQIMDVLKRLEL